LARQALGKEGFLKKRKKYLPRATPVRLSAKSFFFKKGKLFAESEPDGLSAKKASMVTTR
jgi:hypothetical protein